MGRKERPFIYSLFILFIIIDLLTRSLARRKIPNYNLSPRYVGNVGSYIDEFSALAEKYSATNLGVGSPDFNTPEFLRKDLAAVTMNKDVTVNQYSAKLGRPRLLKALAKLYSKVLNRNLDPTSNIIVTIGATEALLLSIQATTSPKYEWIIFEPYYEVYVPMIRIAGGVIKYIPLLPKKTTGNISSADWLFDKKKLKNLFNERTRAILINNPHNPTGKVFTRQELKFIADLAIKWNTLVVSDEVYEWLMFDSSKHEKIASLPGMFERTITIGSASKTFAATGWRIGWAYGPSELTSILKSVQPKIVDSCPSPLQEALAMAIEQQVQNFRKPSSHILEYSRELQSKRDFMVRTLLDVGMTPTISQAGYFLLTNWTALESKVDLGKETDDSKDYKFVNWMVKDIDVLVLPISNYYGDKYKQNGDNFKSETLVEVRNKLLKLNKLTKQ